MTKNLKGTYTITLGDRTQYVYHINDKDNSWVERVQGGKTMVNIKILPQDFERVVNALKKEV